MKKRLYLVLAIVGFIWPSILVVIESVETGNILLYTDFSATFNGMFGNRISTIFSIDLLYAVCVFFIWSYNEARKYKTKQVYLVWILTMLFGLAGGFPLFLYFREKQLTPQTH
ncbi:DUF2834 domain-containing protein [uncultured Psychroserpens sp.]|uniref:DUF2834 domain-containing protein n=1 Tax=uncultured Psychroserpens sp. TaxID=255436 RepID=UPI0026056237|nr:DUF2834 domain-containing protein [uncultured Psychroserpens sp.]